MNQDVFKEELLCVMEGKVHWAWPAFGDGTVKKERLHIHFEQEYEAYVRDFPMLLGRAFVQCPHAQVRRYLAENLYEEETGGLSGGKPHPELFLRYPRGLGMDMSRFANIQLLEGAAVYRRVLDELTHSNGWECACAVTTLFLEGTRYERGELEAESPKRPEPPLSQHPLVVHYGLPLEDLELTKTHRQVEGSHRSAAWLCLLDFVSEAQRPRVVAAMQQTLQAWRVYRDSVAEACGLTKASGQI